VAALRRLPARQLAALAAALALAVLALGCSEEKPRSEVAGVRLVQVPGAALASWSPDGQLIAVPGSHGIVLLSRDGKPAGRIEAPPQQTWFGAPTPVQWSSGGRRLGYFTSAGPERGGGLWATQVGRDGDGTNQTSLGTGLAFPTWSPDGWPVVFATGPFEWQLDGSRSGPPPSLRTISKPDAPATELLATTGLPENPVVSDAQILFKQTLHHQTELWTVGLDGSNPHRLASFLYVHLYAEAPKGRQIALSATPKRGNERRLFLLPGDGGQIQPVGAGAIDEGPTWSPDGRWLTFSTPEGEIRRIHPDGSGVQTIASLPGEEIRGLRWSPDGKRLLYSAHPIPNESYD
jgi:Tol biopolymer transport system component